MSGKLTILPVETVEERRAFIRFPWEVYKGDPYWVPPLLSEREEFLDPAKHPFHQHANVRCFTARRDGQVVGTIAGIINDNHNRHWDEQVGFFGLFEVLEDQEAAEALLRTAENFVRGEGMTAIRGPMNFSTNEECGLLVDGWNGPPRALMTYNPRYYVDFIERAGYFKAQDLYAYLIDLSRFKPDGTGLNPKVVRVLKKIRDRTGVTIRQINMKDFENEAERFKQIYNAAWKKNWGFVPVTAAEQTYFQHTLKPLLDPNVCFFVEKEGQPIGVTLPIPDLNQALIRAYPRPGVPEWWTMLKLLYWWKVRKVVTIIRAYAGGVIEAYRGQGLDALMGKQVVMASVQQGYKQMEVSWILESNTAMRQEAVMYGGEIYRTYRIYEKALA